MKSVGIITFHRVINYGAVLQATALQKKIEQLGYESEIIDYYSDFYDHDIMCFSKNILKRLMQYVQYSHTLTKRKKFKRFLKEATCVSQQEYTKDNISVCSNEKKYNLFITGSDQVWNPLIVEYDSNFLLSFVRDKSRCFSYAASIGLGSLNDSQGKWLLEGIRDYGGISVRETTASIILDEIGIERKTQVCDPTFLLGEEGWSQYERRIHLPPKYVFLFMFGGDEVLIENAESYARRNNCEICTIDDRFFPRGGKTIPLKGIGPDEWLYVVHNAEAVFTNSFHGLAFSMIFNKEFWVSDPKDGTVSRIDELLKVAGIAGRVLSTENAIPENVEIIDYKAANERMRKFVSHSEKYIKSICEGFAFDYSEKIV